MYLKGEDVIKQTENFNVFINSKPSFLVLCYIILLPWNNLENATL